VLTYGGTLGVLIYRYVRVFSSSQRQQAKWLLFGFGGLFVLVILYDLIGSLFPCLAVVAQTGAAYLLVGSEASRITLHAAAPSSFEHFSFLLSSSQTIWTDY
jgi:hypothetical protein